MKQVLLLASVVCLLAGPSMAGYVLPTFDFGTVGPGGSPGFPGDPSTNNYLSHQFDVDSIPVGEVYSAFEITFDWTNAGTTATFPAWSNETRIMLTDDAFPVETLRYKNFGETQTGSNSAATADDVFGLLYEGDFGNFSVDVTGDPDDSYVGGNPLWFVGWQVYSNTFADWNNISVTLKTFADYSISTLVDGSVVSDNNASGKSVYGYASSNYNGPEHIYEIDHLGGSLTVDLDSADAVDFDLLLYGDQENLIQKSNSGTSAETITQNLPAGKYYVRIEEFAAGTGNYTLAVTPEPTTLSLLLIGAVAVVRRRR